MSSSNLGEYSPDMTKHCIAQLTPWYSIFAWVISSYSPDTRFPVIMKHDHCDHKIPSMDAILSQLSPVHFFTLNFCNADFNINLGYIPYIFQGISYKNFVCICHSP